MVAPKIVLVVRILESQPQSRDTLADQVGRRVLGCCRVTRFLTGTRAGGTCV